MEAAVTKTYEAPPIDRAEILRYAGAKPGDAALEEMLDRCLTEAERVLKYEVCYREFDVTCRENGLDLGFCATDSRDLARALAGCDGIVLFAATVGIGIDRLIARNRELSPVRALLFQAIGTERVEALCETFCRELAARKEKEGCATGRRYSPGYGDLPLSIQPDVARVLECEKRIGVTVGERLLMTPSKTVTAIVGIKKKEK